jgi:hypothetical protein
VERQKLLEPIFDPQIRDAEKVLDVGGDHHQPIAQGNRGYHDIFDPDGLPGRK